MKVILSRRGLVAAILGAGSVLVQAKQSTTQEAPRSQTQPSAQQSEARTKISVNSELVVVPLPIPPSSHQLGVGEPPLAAPTNLGSRPTKALDDAVHSAAELLHDRGASRRKIILLISDGLNEPQFNHHTYADTLEVLLQDNISVYSLAVGHSLKRKFSRLVNYANDSGGDIYYAVQSAAMERLYSRITEQARHEYTLAYVPHVNNRNASYHKVEVHTTREGVTIRTRQGYYTGPLVVPAKQ